MEFKGTKSPWQIGIAFQGETNNIKIKTCGELITVEAVDGKAVALLGRISELETNANALLISKAPEMLEKLKECIDILDVKCTDGCINKTWRYFQNGNGEDIGIEIDRFIKESKQLIRSATEL